MNYETMGEQDRTLLIRTKGDVRSDELREDIRRRLHIDRVERGVGMEARTNDVLASAGMGALPQDPHIAANDPLPAAAGHEHDHGDDATDTSR